jgi:hypothetical protein
VVVPGANAFEATPAPSPLVSVLRENVGRGSTGGVRRPHEGVRPAATSEYGAVGAQSILSPTGRLNSHRTPADPPVLHTAVPNWAALARKRRGAVDLSRSTVGVSGVGRSRGRLGRGDAWLRWF